MKTKRKQDMAQQLQTYANSKEADMVRMTQGRQFGKDRLHGRTM